MSALYIKYCASMKIFSPQRTQRRTGVIHHYSSVFLCVLCGEKCPGVYTIVVSICLLLLSGSQAPAIQQPLQPPKISAEFQTEVNKFTAEGWQMKEAVETSLAAGLHHLAAIFERTGKQDTGAAYELRIIESDGKTAKTIFRRSEFFLSFAALKEMQKLNATDLNGDGVNEILVQSSSGGNCWACNPVEIYQVKEHKAVLMAAAPIQKLVDLNNDGKLELIVADGRWESYADLSHAASPAPKLIYSWSNGRYLNVSRDFPEFYRKEVETLQTAIAAAKGTITDAEGSDDFYVGLAITLAITYRHAGEIERGLKEMETLLQENAKSPEQTKRRAATIRDFRLGDSAQKILAIKYGDPIL